MVVGGMLWCSESGVVRWWWWKGYSDVVRGWTNMWCWSVVVWVVEEVFGGRSASVGKWLLKIRGTEFGSFVGEQRACV